MRRTEEVGMLNMCTHRLVHTWSAHLIGAELIHGLNQAEIWFLALMHVDIDVGIICNSMFA